MASHWKGRTDNPIFAYWKGKSGAHHNSSRPVRTPFGIFGSLREACRYKGMPLLSAQRLLNRGKQGYDTGWFWL